MSTQLQTQTKAASQPSLRPVQTGLLQSKCACGQHTIAGGECEECRQKREGMVQRSAIATAPVNKVPPIVHEVLSSPGQPLDVGARAFMEPRFGHDFSHVRVHTNAPIIQTKLTVNEPGDKCEQEADWVAEQVMRNSLRSALVPQISLLSSSYQSDVLNIQRQASVKKCSEEKKEKILEGIENAKDLTDIALEELNRMAPLSHVIQAIKTNFGPISDEQKKTIISRYNNIKETLDSKEIECKPGSQKKKGADLCAEGRLSGNEIFILPPFGESGCPPGPVILHEAAHNANATADIDKGKGYPPKAAENNAYSYEYFVSDVKKGPPKVELRPHQPTVPGE